MRRSLWWVSVVGLVVATLACAVAGGWLMIAKGRYVGIADGPAQRSVVLDVARAALPTVFGYDYQTVERSFADAEALLTPKYRTEFQKNAADKVIPDAKKRQIVVQAKVVGSAVESLDRDSAKLLVFLNRTVTEAGKEPVFDGSRLRVEMQRVDDKWLISNVAPV